MLSDLYYPVMGGGERHVRALSIKLAQLGHQVHVCTTGGQDLPRYEDDENVKVHRMEGYFQRIPFIFKDPMKKWHPPIRDWSLTNQLQRVALEIEPDIMHAHGRILHSALPLKRSLGIPTVFTMHSYALICPKTDFMRGNVICAQPFTPACIPCGKDSYGLTKSALAYLGTKKSRGGLSLVDRFIAVSPFVRDVHAEYLGLSDVDITMIPNFYEPDGEDVEAESPTLPQDFILFVGAFIPNKGVHILLEAFKKLDTETKLVLIGGSHPDYRYQGTDNIVMIENAPHSAVMKAFSGCRFAVFPSIWADPCPTVAFEAMSQRKAVIATDLGGFRDIVTDGETGLHVPANDSDKLAEAISSLLKRPELAARMGEAGYKRFTEHYSLDIVAPKILDTYQNLL